MRRRLAVWALPLADWALPLAVWALPILCALGLSLGATPADASQCWGTEICQPYKYRYQSYKSVKQCVSRWVADQRIRYYGATLVGPELCDGVDNDCDGRTDEYTDGPYTTCGVGECAGNRGREICESGELVDSCDPYEGASPEVCNGLDDNCDGYVDEGCGKGGGGKGWSGGKGWDGGKGWSGGKGGKGWLGGKGKGGKHGAFAWVSYYCLGRSDEMSKSRPNAAYIENSVVLEDGYKPVLLDAIASSGVSYDKGTYGPVHRAGAAMKSWGMKLHPYDECASYADSALDAVVIGTHRYPGQWGEADVEFVIHYDATFEIREKYAYGTSGFAALTDASLEVLGVPLDEFEVLATKRRVKAPPGLHVADISSYGVRRYRVWGERTVYGRLAYGYGTASVVSTKLSAGSGIRGSKYKYTTVSGYAIADALDSMTYEIRSLDPDVSFTFLEAGGD